MGHIDLSLQCPISNSGRVRMNRQNGASLQHGVGPREEILPSSARSHALTLTNHKNVTMRRFYCVLGGCKGARNRKWFTIGNYSLKRIVAACGGVARLLRAPVDRFFDARLQIAWKRRQAKEEQFWPPGNWKATVLFAICAVHVSVRFFFSDSYCSQVLLWQRAMVFFNTSTHVWCTSNMNPCANFIQFHQISTIFVLTQRWQAPNFKHDTGSTRIKQCLAILIFSPSDSPHVMPHINPIFSRTSNRWVESWVVW